MLPLASSHVFLVTYGRSGSTLLQNILNALPNTCIRGENGGLARNLAQAVQVFENAQPAASVREHGLKTSSTHPWYGAERFDPYAFAKDLAQNFNTHVLQPPPGTERAGFKEIRWHEPEGAFTPTLDFLADNFPNTRFIFNLRDHEAVLRSGWWARQDPGRVRSILEKAEALYADYARRHPHLCLTLRYEDYVAEPAKLKPMFDHIGAGWDEDMVRTIMSERLTHLQKTA